MESLQVGTIIDIKNIPKNETSANYGIVVGTDDIFTYFLPITKIRVEDYGRFYSITKSSITKNIIGSIDGYIDFDSEYSTEYLPVIAGRFCNDLEIEDIINQYHIYQKIKEKNKPIIKITK